MSDIEPTGSPHHIDRVGEGGDRTNPRTIISPSDEVFDLLKKLVDESIKAELSTLREYVDQRLKEINQRIDGLHAHVTGGEPAIYTDVTLENMSNGYLTLYDQHHWYGYANFPLVIPPHLSEKIKHYADSKTGDSKGGVAYTIKKNIRWVVAWSNMKDQDNKVYINVIETDGEIDWNVYQSLLDTSSPKPNAVNKYWNRVVANIDPSSTTPLMKAKLSPAVR